MTTYYKATRLDGTDFQTGTIHYEVGKRIRPAASQGCRRICGPGYLHASNVPTETLVVGNWPCRLFEVSGRPDVGFDTTHPHKGGFKQLTVVRELDAHLALGPQGHEIVAVIERARVLTQDEMSQLGAARDAAGVAARDAAGVAARDAAFNEAFNAARVATWDAARVAAWGAARVAAWGAAGVAVWGAAGVAAKGAAGVAVWDAAGDAANALVVRDLISQEHFDILYGPWRQVIEDGQ